MERRQCPHSREGGLGETSPAGTLTSALQPTTRGALPWQPPRETQPLPSTSQSSAPSSRPILAFGGHISSLPILPPDFCISSGSRSHFLITGPSTWGAPFSWRWPVPALHPDDRLLMLDVLDAGCSQAGVARLCCVPSAGKAAGHWSCGWVMQNRNAGENGAGSNGVGSQ